jgi:parvulin-like peptidyl-prolyl isomerase
MFEKLREPWRGHDFRKTINIAIFGFICLIFVFVGWGNDRTGISGVGTAATVNDTVISAQDFQERLHQYEAQGGQEKNMPAAQRQMQEKRERERAIDDLVTMELLYQSAIKNGVSPTNAATRDMIVNIPQFQNDGRFAKDNYKQFLESRQMSASDFEGKVKHDVVINQVSQLFSGAWSPPKLVDDLTKEVRGIKINFDYVKVDPAQMANANVTSADVAAFLAKPENKTQVKANYDAHVAEYGAPEKVRAHQILIKGADALAKITALQKEATMANFSDLARKNSQDEGSKAKGGDLGYLAREDMLPEFATAAFNAKPGAIVGPVKSPLGYHLILVDDRKASTSKPYESVESNIAKNLIADSRKDEVVNELTKAAKEKSGFDAVVAKYHLKWQDGGELSAGESYIQKLGLGEDAVNAALTTPPGSIYGDVLHSGSNAYFIKVKDVKNTKEAANPAMDSMQFQRYAVGREILGLWTEDLRKDAHIEINGDLLK